MSAMSHTFSFWACSSEDCTYVVSSNPNAVKFFKGHAVVETKRRGEKDWKEFDF